ncbi:unnamed protein product [Staurois parvus]|uniref:Secreted protein n=1 Tax=Staurois parvus TaxID=386267 RepID=A0ABN9D907_9NEOB|nr:unnamed protein product [Staurois parvus]
MRCPWYLFHRLFCVWVRTQGPHDPLLPGGPLSCQSAPATDHAVFSGLMWSVFMSEGPGSVGGPMRCPWYLFHRLF